MKSARDVEWRWRQGRKINVADTLAPRSDFPTEHEHQFWRRNRLATGCDSNENTQLAQFYFTLDARDIDFTVCAHPKSDIASG
jgi:hypothetical protein